MAGNFIDWYKNKCQWFREHIVAPIMFKLMDIVGFRRHLPFTYTGEDAQELIYQTLIADKPCMIGRIGATEIRAVEGALHEKGSFFQKIKWFLTMHQTGISKKICKILEVTEDNPDKDYMRKFAGMIIEDARELDVFASWRWEETSVFQEPYKFNVVDLGALEPFFSDKPWTRALRGKKVLIIQPFVQTIKNQYQRREKLFKNQDILPEFELINYMPFFCELREAPGGKKDWIANLECMKKEISQLEFDIAIIAAGTYGFHLAAHIKRMGKKAVLMGGVLQLLFGIRGARWDKLPAYNAFYNEFWVRPGAENRPETFSNMDGGCYW